MNQLFNSYWVWLTRSIYGRFCPFWRCLASAADSKGEAAQRARKLWPVSWLLQSPRISPSRICFCYLNIHVIIYCDWIAGPLINSKISTNRPPDRSRTPSCFCHTIQGSPTTANGFPQPKGTSSYGQGKWPSHHVSRALLSIHAYGKVET